MNNRRVLVAVLIIFLSLFWVSQGFSLMPVSHRVINEFIARGMIKNFSLNLLLINQLGFQNGIEESLKMNSQENMVYEWLGIGGIIEDEPDGLFSMFLNNGRSNHHFHNPVRPWNDAGLDDTVLKIRYTGQSSILWAQNPGQNVGEKGSWQDARKYYLEGLTAPSKSERDSGFAKTFRSLGQLMHLVQDASVPAHVRNDIHIRYNYENWLVNIQTYEPDKFGKFIENPISFDKSILIFPENPFAPIPIAKIIDTDQYTKENPEITVGNSIGIAEYASVNFFSKDTVFSSEIPFPARSSVITADYNIPDPRDEKKTVTRQYYRKVKDGDAGYRLATVGFLRNYITKYFTDYTGLIGEALDGGVYLDYAERLLSRAVGYSAGLLEYFFRGQLEVLQGRDGIQIKNLSAETMDGKFTFYYDATDGSRKPVKDGEWSFPLEPNTASNSLKVSDPEDINEKGEYMLVFQGQLGKEINAIVGKKWVRQYYWTLVVDYPPSPKDRYRIRYEEIPGTWTDCPLIAGDEFNVSITDRCPNAGPLKVYLLAMDQTDYDPKYNGCGQNLDSQSLGQFSKAELLSKIYYQNETSEVSWRQILDQPYRNTHCRLKNGKDGFVLDISETTTAGPAILFSWETISAESPEISAIQAILFPDGNILSGLKASNFANEGYRNTILTKDFSYPTTGFLANYFYLCSQDEAKACYCSDPCPNQVCLDGYGLWCLDVIGYIPNDGPIERNIDLKIIIPDLKLEYWPWGRTERFCFDGNWNCSD